MLCSFIPVAQALTPTWLTLFRYCLGQDSALGFPSSGADQRKWLIKLGYRLPQNGITKQWNSFPSGQTIQRTTSSIFSLIASFAQSDARSKLWYVWGQIKNSWLLYSYTLDFTRYGKSNSVSNKSFWKSAQVSQTQPEREKTWQRARGSALQRSLFSWRTDPPRLQKCPGGRLQLHLRKTLLIVRVAQQLNGLRGEVESLEVFKVERSPLEKGLLHLLRG